MLELMVHFMEFEMTYVGRFPMRRAATQHRGRPHTKDNSAEVWNFYRLGMPLTVRGFEVIETFFLSLMLVLHSLGNW